MNQKSVPLDPRAKFGPTPGGKTATLFVGCGWNPGSALGGTMFFIRM
jgi:hypothetical protein